MTDLDISLQLSSTDELESEESINFLPVSLLSNIIIVKDVQTDIVPNGQALIQAALSRVLLAPGVLQHGFCCSKSCIELRN